MRGSVPVFVIFLILYLCVFLPISMAKKAAEKQKQAAASKKSTPEKKAPEKNSPGQEPGKPPAGSGIPGWKAPQPEQEGASLWEHDHSPYVGSLNVASEEGNDPCHEEQLQSSFPSTASGPAPEAAPVPGLQLNWTADEIVRGLVVSEVLNRKVR